MEKILRVSLSARSNQSILKETNPEYSLEGLMLKLKLQYLGHLTQSDNSGKDPDAGKDWRQKEKRGAEDEMLWWHHLLNGHKFEQIPGDSEGQGSLAWCSSWGHKELDMTEQLTLSLYTWFIYKIKAVSMLEIFCWFQFFLKEKKVVKEDN